MHDNHIHHVMAVLEQECQQWEAPSVTVITEQYRSAFHVLVSCIVSLRTKDAVTAAASARLFSRAGSPREMVSRKTPELPVLIILPGFYVPKPDQF